MQYTLAWSQNLSLVPIFQTVDIHLQKLFRLPLVGTRDTSAPCNPSKVMGAVEAIGREEEVVVTIPKNEEENINCARPIDSEKSFHCLASLRYQTGY